jgi:hypothetical protein
MISLGVVVILALTGPRLRHQTLTAAAPSSGTGDATRRLGCLRSDRGGVSGSAVRLFQEERMTDDLDEMGPIDYIVVEFPGSKMNGEAFPHLIDLVDRGIVRILDLVFVSKDLDGSVKGIAIADLDDDGELDLAVFEGASSGLISDDDIEEAGGILEPGSSGGHPRLRERLGRPVRRRR